eukprot:s5614_g2.t1
MMPMSFTSRPVDFSITSTSQFPATSTTTATNSTSSTRFMAMPAGPLTSNSSQEGALPGSDTSLDQQHRQTIGLLVFLSLAACLCCMELLHCAWKSSARTIIFRFWKAPNGMANGMESDVSDSEDASDEDAASKLLERTVSLIRMRNSAEKLSKESHRDDQVLMPWRGEVAAIACQFMGGVATGAAWASVLFGDVAPRGRLPVMMPETSADVIPVGQDAEVVYSEGLLTSYRSPTFRAAFPFGHGLTFTSFEYSGPHRLDKDCGTAVCVTVLVKNVGQRSGEELVQAYVHFPEPVGGDEAWIRATPDIMLKAFQRTKVLHPGESQTVRFDFSASDMKLFCSGRGWVPQQKIEACKLQCLFTNLLAGHRLQRLRTAPIHVGREFAGTRRRDYKKALAVAFLVHNGRQQGGHPGKSPGHHGDGKTI